MRVSLEKTCRLISRADIVPDAGPGKAKMVSELTKLPN